MSLPKTAQAVVLLGHGSKRAAPTPFAPFCQWLAESQPGLRVADAYLSLCPPTLDETVDALVQEGYRSIAVIPMFLVEGHHVLEDMPKAIEALMQRHPGLDLSLSPALGADAAMAGLLKARLQQAKPWNAALKA